MALLANAILGALASCLSGVLADEMVGIAKSWGASVGADG